ncbi:MAG: aldose 1-epimerase family protein [Candidatus Limiplasma sp.]|nr:aldose 1-epimerase family protein [Candidatus Limiplasma sp.]MEA5145625.1 aldose 1-epimerase family protein [Candidatus Limiplasma sp.]
MAWDVREALRQGYISREDPLVYQQEMLMGQGDGRLLRCHELALPNLLGATVLWDRCMDITRLTYRGIPLAFAGKSAERLDAAVPFEQRFSGGMLYTCGLLNVGPGDAEQPTHGRIHLQSAAMRSIRRDGDALVLQGQMRESALFGENLLLERTLTFPLDRAEVQIRDAITNQTQQEQPYMLLYHINLGYPLLSEHLRLQLPQGTHTVPATAHASRHRAELTCATAPQPDAQEQDFYHTLPIRDGYCAVAAENPALGIGLSIRYRADTLPYLIQWRCLRSGDYVLGLEPANHQVTGRAQAKALPQIAPFETITTEVRLQVYDLPGGTSG